MSVFNELTKRQDFFGRLLFEIVIIFIGVTAAFALEAARQEREEQRYRESMIAAMVPTFDDMQRHNRIFIEEAEAKIEAFDRDLAAGKQPLLPIYREAERNVRQCALGMESLPAAYPNRCRPSSISNCRNSTTGRSRSASATFAMLT